jgi:hypothetical protein
MMALIGWSREMDCLLATEMIKRSGRCSLFLLFHLLQNPFVIGRHDFHALAEESFPVFQNASRDITAG